MKTYRILIALSLGLSQAAQASHCQEKIHGYYLEMSTGDKIPFLNLKNCQTAEAKIEKELSYKNSVLVRGCERHLAPVITGPDPITDFDYLAIHMHSYSVDQNNNAVRRTSSAVNPWEWTDLMTFNLGLKQAEETCIERVAKLNEREFY